MQKELSGIVNRYVEQTFELSEREKAKTLLLEITSTGSGNQATNRCEIAALKVSGGTLMGLERAVRMYQLDFRDLLMSAGFGSDTKAHETWTPEDN